MKEATHIALKAKPGAIHSSKSDPIDSYSV